MKKIFINLPETKKEAIEMFVKSSVSSEDIDRWLIYSKKENILNKLEILNELAIENNLHLANLKKTDYLEIASQVEHQVAELIVGFE